MATVLQIEQLQYLTMMQNGSLKRISRPLSWIFKIIFLTVGAPETHSASVCQIGGDRSYYCRDITIFCIF